LIAAKYNDLIIEEVIIEMGVTNKKPDFLAKFPLGKVPCFEGVDGFTLFESSAIAQYGMSFRLSVMMIYLVIPV
jgi:elongation factor 1-gamma